MIQIFSNSLGEEELAAVKDVFDSKWIGSGNHTKSFEEEFSSLVESKYSLTFNSATSALFSSIRILDIGQGDEVLIPSINFVGCSNAIIDAGATPVFCDVDLRTLNILPEEVYRKRNSKTKALLLLHYGGHPAPMDDLKDAATGLRIIEDSANSIVSKYKGKNCGTLGDLGIYSFDAMKFIVVGDGGMLTIQDDYLYERAQQFRYFGLRPKSKSGIDSLNEGNKRWWEIDLIDVSGRYITNDIASAIGRVQLKKLSSIIARRKTIWNIYQEELKSVNWLEIPPEPLAECESSYYLYWLKIKGNMRDHFANYMIENGIYVTFRYYPLHKISHYQNDSILPNSERVNEETINIPIHQNISDREVDYIIHTIRAYKS
jgi:aminotransferase